MAALASPTLGKLIFNVRNFLGQPDPGNSSWTDSELKEYLNEAVRMYFAEIVKNSDGYFTTTTTLGVTANTETVALPSDCFEVKALYIQRSNGWELLEYRNDVTGGIVTGTGAGGGGTFSPSYSFLGNNLLLRPVPSFTQSGILRLDYVQFPDQMVNGGDTATAQVSPVFKQLLEMYAVYKAKLKQSMVSGTDLTALPKSNLAEIYATFKAAIGKRSQYPEFVIPFSPEDY